jgi:hypothetical protein
VKTDRVGHLSNAYVCSRFRIARDPSTLRLRSLRGTRLGSGVYVEMKQMERSAELHCPSELDTRLHVRAFPHKFVANRPSRLIFTCLQINPRIAEVCRWA